MTAPALLDRVAELAAQAPSVQAHGLSIVVEHHHRDFGAAIEQAMNQGPVLVVSAGSAEAPGAAEDRQAAMLSRSVVLTIAYVEGVSLMPVSPLSLATEIIACVHGRDRVSGRAHSDTHWLRVESEEPLPPESPVSGRQITFRAREWISTT